MGTFVVSALLVVNCVVALIVLAKNEEGRSRVTSSGMVWHYPLYHPVVISGVFAIGYTIWTCVRIVARGVTETPELGLRVIALIIVVTLLTFVRKPNHWIIPVVVGLSLVVTMLVILGGVPADLHRPVVLTTASVLPSFYWMLRWRAHPTPVRSLKIHAHTGDVQFAMAIWVVVHIYVFHIQIIWAYQHWQLLLNLAVLVGCTAIAGLLLFMGGTLWKRIPQREPRASSEFVQDRSAPHFLPE